jgi:DNA polymerase
VPSGAPTPASSQPRSAAEQLTQKPELTALAAEASGCTRCRLAQGRTQVVFGVGNPDADLVFVGEAPGFHEDQQGYPFVGAAGKLLDKLLAGIGLTRRDVYIANVLKCRPPGNRDPMPDEIESCESYLFRQLSIIEPKLVATLGNFATKLLSGKQHGITRVHGQPQPAQVGGLPVVLYPLYHPAAALYTPAMLRTLEDDFARIPQLLAENAGSSVAAPESLELDADVIPFPQAAPEPVPVAAAPAEQLELF